MSRRVHWLLMAAVLAVALGVGAPGPAGPPTPEQEVRAITEVIRCPTCRGLSAAVSDAPAARAIRDEVSRRVAIGETRQDIVGYLEASYGADILLEPAPTGAGLWVWVLPVAFVAVCVVGISAVLARRRASRPAGVSKEDRELVERARKQ